MQNICNVCGQQNHGQGADDLCAVGSHNGSQQAEHTNGGQLQDQFHNLHEHFVGLLNQGTNLGCLLTHQDNAEADKQGDDDDLQHIGVDQRCQEVGGEDVNQNVHEGSGFLGFIGQITGGQCGESALHKLTQDQTDDDGHSGGQQVVNDGLDADGAHLTDVLHGDHAAQDGEQDDGADDELQQVQEDGTEGLDVGVGKAGTLLTKQQTCDDGQHQSNEDLEGQIVFDFLHLTYLFSEIDFRNTSFISTFSF